MIQECRPSWCGNHGSRNMRHVVKFCSQSGNRVMDASTELTSSFSLVQGLQLRDGVANNPGGSSHFNSLSHIPLQAFPEADLTCRTSHRCTHTLASRMIFIIDPIQLTININHQKPTLGHLSLINEDLCLWLCWSEYWFQLRVYYSRAANTQILPLNNRMTKTDQQLDGNTGMLWWASILMYAELKCSNYLTYCTHS